MHLHWPYFDCVVASLPGDIIKGDHTFGVSSSHLYIGFQIINSDYLIFSSQNPLLTLEVYTMLNHFEDTHGQALTLTNSLDLVEGVYTKLAAGLKEHGHRPTQLMYTDNAQAELSFHERTTPSLQDNCHTSLLTLLNILPSSLSLLATSVHTMRQLISLILLAIIFFLRLQRVIRKLWLALHCSVQTIKLHSLLLIPYKLQQLMQCICLRLVIDYYIWHI